MIDPDLALRRILRSVRPLRSEIVDLESCCGRVIAGTVRARCDLPAFDNSAMDGYALRARDVIGALEKSPVRLAVKQIVAAGNSRTVVKLTNGQTAKIMTGAMMPLGADSVVPREQTREMGGHVEIFSPVEKGLYVRRRGMDAREGQTLIHVGRKIRPYEIALLAAQGISQVRVIRRPRVGIVTSGNELVEYKERPSRGQIRDANGPALSALIERWGCGVLNLGIAPDNPKALRQVFARGLKRCDILLVSGGVSIGDFDHTRGVLEGLGFKTLFWRVRIKPGKPLLFGMWKNKPVFGLPGNPLSALVCSEAFVRPMLAKMSGEPQQLAQFPLQGNLNRPFSKPKGLRQYLFCAARKKNGSFILEVLKPQASAMLAMSARANALAIGPISAARLKAGEKLRFCWLV